MKERKRTKKRGTKKKNRCINMVEVELANKHVVLSPKFYKEPFIFLCKGGFGCSPTSIGNCVVGTFIKDGEEARVERWQIYRLATEEEIKNKNISLESLEEMYLEETLKCNIMSKRIRLLKNISEKYFKDNEEKINSEEKFNGGDLIVYKDQVITIGDVIENDEIYDIKENSKYVVDNIKNMFKKETFEQIALKLHNKKNEISRAEGMIFGLINASLEENVSKNYLYKVISIIFEEYFWMFERYYQE